MLKKMINIEGIQTLNKKTQKAIHAGNGGEPIDGFFCARVYLFCHENFSHRPFEEFDQCMLSSGC